MRRRGILLGIAAAGMALAGSLYRFTDIFVRHYPPTAYDDLLEQLTDREQAAKLGRQVTGRLDAAGLADRLRRVLKGRSLTAAAESDIAAGQTTEVEGWVLPQTVAWLSALAAKV